LVKNKLFFLVFLLVIYCYPQGEGGVFTQSRLAALKTGEGSLGNNPHAIEWFNELRRKTSTLGQERSISLDDIEGSVYLDVEFYNGTVYYLNEEYQNFPMRYDAYNDEIEIKRSDSRQLQALHKSPAISCEIKGQRVVYLEYQNKDGSLSEGYLFRYFEGPSYSFYVKHAKIFKEAKQAKTSLQVSFPHRFVDDEQFYIKLADGVPTFTKPQKNQLLEIFGKNNERAVKRFIKENRLNLSNIDDMVKLVAYANAL
tara:strand:+ start:4443 stop:5207 length:765 start_codon:yes stop_codon:yes gene_type:complete